MPKIIKDKSTINASIDYIKKYDAFKNATSGYGGTYDNVNKIQFQGNNVLTNQEIEDLYRYDWISRRIIEAIPDDALSKWITLTDNTNNELLEQKIKEFKLKKKIQKALYLARLYGGSVMLLATRDGSNPKSPLKPNADITCINVLDKNQIRPVSDYTDPWKSNFGEPEIYELNAIARRPGLKNSNDLSKNRRQIHESRLIRVDGNFLPDLTKIQNDGWHDSILNSINVALTQCGLSLQSGALLMQDFVTKVLKLPNLVELLANREYEMINIRIQYALANLSQSGIALVGADEEFDKIQTPITGLVDLLDKYIEQVSGASKIPRSRLFSQTLGVLAGATETTRNYYDFLLTYQIDEIRPLLEKLLSFLNNGNIPNFIFNPLWTPTQKEQVEIHKTQMEADAGYIDRQVITPEEVSLSRFGDKGYSTETTLLTEQREQFNDLSRKKTTNTEET